MTFIILGAGGIGSFYGAKLIEGGHKVLFIARGAHLEALQKEGLKLKHPKFNFNSMVEAVDLSQLTKEQLLDSDALILTTKSTSTRKISEELSIKLEGVDNIPYLLSLQNGVENEDILASYFPKDRVIGGLCRKIGAHIISAGVIEATGDIETIIGTIKASKKSRDFLIEFKSILESSNIACELTEDIRFELWKKLIINNGVNAICALLRIKTGELMNHKKLSKIVLSLMKETAQAANIQNIYFF